MTRRLLALTGLCLCAYASSATAQQQVDNVAAFARLYGVARWFYPSDAAASLDWNRFAVEGVRRVRESRTSAELETTLKQLFYPLGPGIEIGTSLPPIRPAGGRDPALVAWHYRGAGMTEMASGPYNAKRINRATAVSSASTGGFGTIAQIIRADTLRGKTIRMKGQVRAPEPNSQGWGGLWLRVDRTGGMPGFFDNMQNRPVREATWREYVIEGPVAGDASQIVFGVIYVGSTTVEVDAIELEVRDSTGNWTRLEIPDASFEASSDSRSWSQNGNYVFSRPSSGAIHGRQFARVASLAPGQVLAALPVDSLETPVTNAAFDMDLALGLKARVRMSLTDAEARTESPAFVALRAALTGMTPPGGRDDVDTRLADAVVAWNVLRHFYPYWRDVDVDWNERLRPQLQNALDAASTREGHYDALRMIVAELRDGHGRVSEVAPVARWVLPVQFRILGEQLVVTVSNDSAVAVGSIVAAIDGTPASTRVRQETQLSSGTLQWRQYRAASTMQSCQPGSIVRLSLEGDNGSRLNIRVSCDRSVPRPVETRPDSIAELQPGIWYVDLTRIRTAQLRPMLDTLAKARGVVFDMRGYPTDVGSAVLPHLMRTAEDSTDRWMHVSRMARPFGEVAAWTSMSWNLRPATPQIAADRVFLTDGRAISYAESVMGYVRDHKLGTIIGGTTAGANGNIANFIVPGGFSIVFTGMRVTRHDARTPYHTIGVSPDIPLEPTLAGIRAGRDELLERALLFLREKR